MHASSQTLQLEQQEEKNCTSKLGVLSLKNTPEAAVSPTKRPESTTGIDMVTFSLKPELFHAITSLQHSHRPPSKCSGTKHHSGVQCLVDEQV